MLDVSLQNRCERTHLSDLVLRGDADGDGDGIG